jgi:hypothetical protein
VRLYREARTIRSVASTEETMSEIEHAYAPEAEARWGHTDAYRESSRRTKSYSKAAWEEIRAESEEIERAFADALTAGTPPDGERATDVAEEARLHIDRWYYPCSRDMHAALAEMYVADERFRAHYDDRVDGLAAYVSEAIRANRERRED